MRIMFAPEALADVMTAILLCPVEISGLGRIERMGEREFLVKEVVIFEQSCSSASTEFDPETPEAVIATMATQVDVVSGDRDMGGTMRLGAYDSTLKAGSKIAEKAISLELPIPPKVLPASRPHRAMKNFASARR